MPDSPAALTALDVQCPLTASICTTAGVNHPPHIVPVEHLAPVGGAWSAGSRLLPIEFSSRYILRRSSNPIIEVIRPAVEGFAYQAANEAARGFAEILGQLLEPGPLFLSKPDAGHFRAHRLGF